MKKLLLAGLLATAPTLAAAQNAVAVIPWAQTRARVAWAAASPAARIARRRQARQC